MLRTRILSALVMVPPALAAIWWGGYAFAALIATAVAIMCWEWHKMLTGGFGLAGLAAAVLCAVSALAAVMAPAAALAGIVVAAVAAAVLAAPGHSRRWAGLGALYCGLPAVALIWLRDEAVAGLHVVLWLMVLVWATDIGAYAAGRTIGGPLLLPAVSPKKTWAGLVGGMVSACAVGAVMHPVLTFGSWLFLPAVSAALAVMAQAGDLWESWVKRRCGVKDSSNVIPGHGGVLDRVDGLVPVAVAAAAALLVGRWGS